MHPPSGGPTPSIPSRTPWQTVRSPKRRFVTTSFRTTCSSSSLLAPTRSPSTSRPSSLTCAKRLAPRPNALAATNPYRVWIAEYAGAPYQEVAAKTRGHLEGLADLYATPAREAELIAIFKEATRLEADFWEMGWRAGQRVE